MKCAFSRKKGKQVLRSSINIYIAHYLSDTSLSTRNSCEHIVSPKYFVRDSTVKNLIFNCYRPFLCGSGSRDIVQLTPHWKTILWEGNWLPGYIIFLVLM